MRLAAQDDHKTSFSLRSCIIGSNVKKTFVEPRFHATLFAKLAVYRTKNNSGLEELK